MQKKPELIKFDKSKYGRFGQSVRYCIKCKQNTTWLRVKGNHSECLMCHNRWGVKPKEDEYTINKV